jgi:dipeptidyl aminopeptidase/acylaminoacyl peptidase
MLNKLTAIKLLIIAVLFGNGNLAIAQNYQTPPKQIADLFNAAPTPTVSFSRKSDFMLILDRTDNPTIEELAQPELRIGGLRINPANSTPSRSSGIENIRVSTLKSREVKTISGLPQNARISGISFSRDERYLAFLNAKRTSVSLWVVDLTTLTAKKLLNEGVNTVFGGGITWTSNNEILVKTNASNRGSMPKAPLAPSGPVIQETSGNAAPSRTYQDLLTNPFEEKLLEYFMNTQIVKVDMSGKTQNIGKSGMIKSFDLSPDGRYLMVDLMKKPFSYLVPASRFPYDIEIWSQDGNFLKTFAQIPLDEVRPTGFDATVKGPRSINWRNDKPATLYWVEAQDGGDPRVKMDVREIVYTQDAPFTTAPKTLATTPYRFGGIYWSDDSFALFNERWSATRKQMVRVINPSNPNWAGDVIIDRSMDDLYNDPGSPVTTTNDFGRSILLRNGDQVFMTSEGGSPEGNMPFLAAFNVKTKTQNIIWRSKAPFYERVVKVLTPDASSFVTLKESTDIQPNYWVVNTKKKIAPIQLTSFDHPYPALKGVNKQLVSYKRKDGLDLSAVLYTPDGYDATKDGRLPVVMWAYPREYKSASDAAQVRGSKYQFTRVNWGSPIYWVTQGYAIMDQTEMPIVGEGDIEPNDSFVEQLLMNAEAAIDFVVNSGVGDRNKIAVGGHSYGAFMTANLLSHSNLFAAGIARSGAYNRTLTPFGFQYEQRTYWESPDVYNTMSPFMNANKVKTPILLIHGEADNNSGTFPIQSERYYNALKGHGATTRLVFLPHESHGYAAKESILHTLYEQHEWLEKWVKNRKQ